MGPGNTGNAPPPADLDELRRELREAAEPERVPELRQFFKTGPGGYGEGDVFLGVRVPAVRVVARRHADLNLQDVTKLLRSPIHEERLAALVILVRRSGRADEQQRQRIYDLYLANTPHVNSWDLVDVSAPHIVGACLLDRRGAERQVLERSFATSSARSREAYRSVSGSFAPSMGSISTVRWKRPRVGVSSNSTHFDEAGLIEAVAEFLGQLEGLRSNC